MTVKILLDTHVIIWSLHDPSRIVPEMMDMILDRTNIVSYSSVSIAEIEIKRSIGKLIVPDDYWRYINQLGLESISFDIEHAIRLGSLPYFHRDPFDRMLIAQCLCSNYTLMTSDSIMTRYSINCLIT